MGKTPIEKHEVLIACQALGAAGLGDGIGGHVSRRVVGQEAFWINAFDRTLSEVTENDIFLVDYDGKVLNGTREISKGFEFHPAIYQRRQEINATKSQTKRKLSVTFSRVDTKRCSLSIVETGHV